MGRERFAGYVLPLLSTHLENPHSSSSVHCLMVRHIGLHRVRDTLHSQLSELLKSKPRNKADESLLSEITRLESELVVARDDLVGYSAMLLVCVLTHNFVGSVGRLQVACDWFERRVETRRSQYQTKHARAEQGTLSVPSTAPLHCLPPLNHVFLDYRSHSYRPAKPSIPSVAKSKNSNQWSTWRKTPSSRTSAPESGSLISESMSRGS